MTKTVICPRRLQMQLRPQPPIQSEADEKSGAYCRAYATGLNEFGGHEEENHSNGFEIVAATATPDSSQGLMGRLLSSANKSYPPRPRLYLPFQPRWHRLSASHSYDYKIPLLLSSGCCDIGVVDDPSGLISARGEHGFAVWEID